MSSQVCYLAYLNSDLTSPQHVQEIAHLSSPPELRSSERQHWSDDEEDEHESEPGEQFSAFQQYEESCCVVDLDTKIALEKWAQIDPKKVLKIIGPLIDTASSPAPASTARALHDYPVPYFFYGTLADPAFLAGKLELEDVPVLQRGTIRGYKVKMWGKYKALIGGQGRGEVVEGWVYMVKTKEDLEKLAVWEGENYEVDLCDVFVKGDEKVLGNVFVFCGGMHNLQELGEDG